MAVCKWCNQEMLDDDVRSCSKIDVEFPDGTCLPQVEYHDYENKRCHDCNIAPDGFHHPGCDWERCPKCQGQLIGCGCLSKEG